ncbi:MAG: hypothetical protein RBS21_06835, partial [Corynebacterium sp.]|nr:hypothetical protein [Corynebacterium sp.]
MQSICRGRAGDRGRAADEEDAQMPHNRPRDRDLAKQLVRELRRDADLPVVFLGMGGQSGVTIGEGIGLRTDGVRGVTVVPGEGL